MTPAAPATDPAPATTPVRAAAPTPAPAGIGESLYEREKVALSLLQHAVADRAAREEAVASAHAAATADADREVARARKQATSARQRAAAELADAHQAERDALDARHTADAEAVERTRRGDRKQVTDKASAALQKLRSEHEDKSWTVESVREAGEKEAADTHVVRLRDAANSRQRLADLKARAEAALSAVGVPWDAIAFDASRLPSAAATDPVGKLEKSLEETERAAGRVGKAPLNALRKPLPTAGLFVACALVGAAIGFALLPFPESLAVAAGVALVGGAVVRVLVGVLAKRQVRDRGRAFGVFHAEAVRAVAGFEKHAEATNAAEIKAVADRYATSKAKAKEFYEPRIADMEGRLAAAIVKIESTAEARKAAVTAARAESTAATQSRHAELAAKASAEADAHLAAVEGQHAETVAAIDARRDADFAKLRDDWFAATDRVRRECAELTAFGDAHFPPFDAATALPAAVPPGVRYGDFRVQLTDMPADARLRVEPIDATVPAYLPFPDRSAVLLRAADEGRGRAVHVLQSTMLRFLTGLPPGKVRFTIIDPVGLGENFAAFMNLADFDENLVGPRIWTEPMQIEQKLTDLTEHMENVIQKYLRNQYKSIEDYNRAAGEVAEPYRVLVIANFPHNFTSDAARRLVSVMASGPACGVCTLMSVDTHATLPRDFRLADLEQSALVLDVGTGRKLIPADKALAAFPLTADAPPANEDLAKLVRKVGQAGREAARVEVPFDFIMPDPADVWKGDASKGFSIPIGRSGATKRQLLQLGKGTAQHALVAGKTGSGKSTLLHAMITNLALIYPPSEAELYLIDFKKGVEFKAYAEAKLPHARVVAIESEREFGLSVLQRLDGILRERGDRYRDAGANDLAGYRAWLRENKPGETCPRILLVVDEFQEFFVEDDKLSQEATLLLDRLVRQGRAFGVHVLLGSQTLGGAFSLARSTIDQMAVRIALQCSEADAQLILSKDNSAARLLNRPGEAIYNDANGLVEGNNPFQVVWLNEDRRTELLAEIRERGHGDYPPPLVFEGSSTADLFKNPAFAPGATPKAGPPVVFLGDPVAIKEPTAAVLRPQSAANVLMLGQQEESALALAVAAMTSLVGRGVQFHVLDGTPADSELAGFLRNAADSLGHPAAFTDREAMPALLAEMAADLERRRTGEVPRTPRVLFVHGLHRLRELRKAEDDYGFGKKSDAPATPGEAFATLIREGPPVGVHVVAWCDTLTNLARAVDRQGLKEFALRVLFQMSPADSSQLIDTPAASRLGRHRALYLEEGAERAEKFRPYGLPAFSQLRVFADRLASPPA
jgi:S-DNA-T family DNA segregation ATPase FtsK/SpoIIIE